MAYTVTDFLADVRREGMLPTTSADGTATADILAQAQYELESRLLPLILQVREEYLIVQKRIAITAGRSSYQIPRRAILGMVREVVLRKANGDLKPLVRIELETVRHMYPSAVTGEPEAFLVRGDYIQVFPVPSSTTGSLQVEFPCRPGRMAETASYPITSVSSTTTTVTYGAATLPGVVEGDYLIDLARADNGFQYFAVDVAPTAFTVSSLTFLKSDLPDDSVYFFQDPGAVNQNQAKGAMMIADTVSNVPLPVELQGILVQATVARMKRQLGELDQASFHEKKTADMEQAFIRMVTPRVDGSPRIIRGGFLWDSKASFYGWLGR